MKKNKILKSISTLIITLIIFSLFALPISAANPQIQINSNFDANSTVRAVFNWLIGIIAIIGAAVGGFHIVMGQMNQDPKERNGGIITVIICLAVGGLMLTILNMVLK